MVNKAVVVALLTALGLTLAGCGPCGFFWDEWRSRSCHGEPAPK
jgi:hypothetical protein